MSLLIERQSSHNAQQDPQQLQGSLAGQAECLQLICIDCEQPHSQPAMRMENSLCLADAYSDIKGRYMALRQQPHRASTFSIVRMSDLQDHSLLTLGTSAYHAHDSIAWHFAWAPDSSLAAVWGQPNSCEEGVGRLSWTSPTHLYLFRACDGKQLHSIRLCRPLQEASTCKSCKTAWSPDCRQFAF